MFYCTVCCLGYAALIVIPQIFGIDVERKVVVVVLLREGEALEDIHMICDDDADEDADEDVGCAGPTVATEETLHDMVIAALMLVQVGTKHEGRAVMKGNGKEVKGHFVVVDPNDAEKSLVCQQLEVAADVVARGLPIEEFALADMHCGGSEACGASILFRALVE